MKYFLQGKFFFFYSECLSPNCAIIKFSLSDWSMPRKVIDQILNIYNLYVTKKNQFPFKNKTIYCKFYMKILFIKIPLASKIDEIHLWPSALPLWTSQRWLIGQHRSGKEQKSGSSGCNFGLLKYIKRLVWSTVQLGFIK